MAATTHRVRSLRMQVRAGSAAQAFVVRTRLRHQWQEMLLPVLERECDELANDDQCVCIQRIDIALRIRSEEELETVFPQLVRNQFKEQLWAALAEERNFWQESAKASVRSEDDDHLANLLYFLEKGSLPWSMAALSPADTKRELLETATRKWAELVDRSLLHAPGTAWYLRLFQMLPSEARKLLVQTVLAQRHRARQDVKFIMDIFFAAETQGGGADLLLLASAAILSDVVRGTASENPPDVPAMLERVARRDQLPQLESLWTLLPEKVRMAIGQVRFQTESENIQSSLEEGLTVQTGGSRPVHSRDRRDHDVNVMDGRSLVSEAAHGDERLEAEAWQESLYPLCVQNAGLVLLHPFLSRLFVHVDLNTAESKALSPYKLPKAAALLHFLATGGQSVEEFELSLIKILLGMRPEAPLLVSEGMLTEGEKREAHVLLQSVIEHWCVLKNTIHRWVENIVLATAWLIARGRQWLEAAGGIQTV